MIVIRNNIIPRPGFIAINVFGYLFARHGVFISESTIRHEMIHTAQMKEMLYIFFYIWYLIEWIIRLFLPDNAYRNIGFEKEAYANDNGISYLETRKKYSWVKYL